MTRDVRRLADTHFDVIVVGAGFYGALAAWDAVLRGLTVALIDKGDFGSGTSFNNFKTLHGGLRSLQSMNLRQMRLFIRERRALARVAPHLVRPMPFIVPTYAHPVRARQTMRAVLAFNDAISSDRHEGIVDPALQLPPGRVVSREDCLQLNPLIDPAGVTGGAIWHDYQMHNTDRMTFSFVKSAVDRGAVAANHVQATGVLRRGVRVEGVRAEDRLTSTPFDVRGSAIVNATGPWAGSFLDLLGRVTSKPAPRLSRAMNFVTRRVDVAQGCGGRVGGRFLFLVPWRDVSIVGTSHDAYEGPIEQVAVTAQDVEGFFTDVGEAFPNAQLSSRDVRLVHRGLLPMIAGDAQRVKLLRESAAVDHAKDGAAGLISLFGVRYTTARDTAARAIDMVFKHRGVAAPPKSRSDQTPVAGGTIASKEQFVRAVMLRDVPGASKEMLQRLALTYGTHYNDVLNLLHDDPSQAEALGARCGVSGAEIQYAARHESAVLLADALIRRTEAGSAGHPGEDAIARAGTIMARELGWNAARLQREIDHVNDFYRLPLPDA
jgi:glycerol-3-phosphate dehydrogenase